MTRCPGCSPAGASCRRWATPTPTPTPRGPRCGPRWTGAPRGGRPLVTHVFNGMPPLHHRAPGPVAACLAQAARGEAVLEVIGDGVHLAAATVRMLFEPRRRRRPRPGHRRDGRERHARGRYTLGGRDVVVAGRTARLADGGSIAGGVATLLEVVRWCVPEAGVPLRRRGDRRVRSPPPRAWASPTRRARGRAAGRPPRRRRRPAAAVACCARGAGWADPPAGPGAAGGGAARAGLPT